MDYQQRFAVTPGGRVNLKDRDPGFHGDYARKEDAEAETDACRQRLADQQRRLYAAKRHSLLIVLQALDTGGKDGTISHVMGAMNPQGCRVQAFRQPSEEERAHDFLWRAHRAAPACGEVVIFNRSHYEDVLAARVRTLVPESTWSKRYGLINAFEQGLAQHDTLVLKFFLHISKAEQLNRFKARLDDPTKQWKISESDYTERARWDEYVSAYEDALSRCSTTEAPWFVIPADHKWFRNLAVAHIVAERLEALHLEYPKPAVDLAKLQAQYHAAK